MRFALQIVLYAIGLPLQVLVISALWRGPFRQYPGVFVYVLADFLTTVLEIWPSLMSSNTKGAAVQTFAQLYWLDERILQGLVFVMVISLVYTATAHMRPRRILLFGIIGGTLGFAAITFLIHRDTQPGVLIGKWMTPWTRDLNFCAAVLDLGLWATLIANRERNYTLLMVSGALGVQFTGDAIAQAMRDLNPTLRDYVATYLVPLPNLTCLYIWWQAFRTAADKARRPQAVPSELSAEKARAHRSAR
jgi:hypothetical protein